MHWTELPPKERDRAITPIAMEHGKIGSWVVGWGGEAIPFVDAWDRVMGPRELFKDCEGCTHPGTILPGCPNRPPERCIWRTPEERAAKAKWLEEMKVRDRAEAAFNALPPFMRRKDIRFDLFFGYARRLRPANRERVAEQRTHKARPEVLTEIDRDLEYIQDADPKNPEHVDTIKWMAYDEIDAERISETTRAAARKWLRQRGVPNVTLNYGI